MDNKNNVSKIQLLTEWESKVLRDADELKITMETQGWKTVIQPIIDQMISDAVGHKEGDLWYEGELSRTKISDTDIAKIVWYRRGLIKFSNSIQEIIAHAKEIRERERRIKENQIKHETTEENYVMPMYDTSYRASPETITKPTDDISGGLTNG